MRLRPPATAWSVLGCSCHREGEGMGPKAFSAGGGEGTHPQSGLTSHSSKVREVLYPGRASEQQPGSSPALWVQGVSGIQLWSQTAVSWPPTKIALLKRSRDSSLDPPVDTCWILPILPLRVSVWTSYASLPH